MGVGEKPQSSAEPRPRPTGGLTTQDRSLGSWAECLVKKVH